MGKTTKIAISFDREFLSKLTRDPSSSVVIQKDTKRLPIHPFHLTDINSSLRDILQKQIAKYDDKLGGILLGYQNVQFLECDRVTFDGSFSHLDIVAEFYVFKPVIGNVLTGVVNKKSKDHVGCLVYNTFNVSIPKPKDEDNWLGYKAQIGNEIKFRITFTDLEHKLPYIRGLIESVISEDSGFSTEDGGIPQNTVVKFDDSDEEKPIEKEEQIELKITKKKKSKKSTKIENSVEEMKKHKKKKKHKQLKEEGEELEEEEDISTKHHKKKKSKKSKEDEEQPQEQEILVDVDKSQEKLSKKKRKIEEANISYEVVSIEKKHKKRKNKTGDVLIEDAQIPDGLDNGDEIICKSKKKNKRKSRDYDQNDSILGLNEVEHLTKVKKHKKKKQKDM